MIRPLGTAGVIAIAVLATTGCTFDTDPMFTLSGTATVNWALAGRADPEVCKERHAENVELVLVDNGGRVAAKEQTPCDGFVWQGRLPTNVYMAKLRMLDVKGATVGRPWGVAFVVGPGQRTSVAVDLVTGAVGF